MLPDLNEAFDHGTPLMPLTQQQSVQGLSADVETVPDSQRSSATVVSTSTDDDTVAKLLAFNEHEGGCASLSK
jgi:hypothetical protein